MVDHLLFKIQVVLKLTVVNSLMEVQEGHVSTPRDLWVSLKLKIDCKPIHQ